MPREIPGTGGFVSWGDDPAKAPPPQKVFPKSQGGAPVPTKREIEGTGGFTSYGGESAKPPADQGDGTWSSLWHDMTHPQAADLSRPQTWRDWVTKTYNPEVSDVGRAALDDVTFGFADPTRAYFTGENVKDLRARTADSQAALGPMGAVINAGTYALPGGAVAKGLAAAGKTAKVARALGRYGAGAVEGGVPNATGSVGHQIGEGVDPLKVAKDTAIGAAFGGGGQVVGDAAAAAARRVSNYTRGSPGRSGEQWDYRERAKAGDPTLQGDIAISQATLPPDHPAQPALARTQTALNQSIEPGLGFNAVAGATGLGAGALGLNEGMHWAEAIVPGGVAGFTADRVGKPLARSVNRADRNINVGQSLDQLYPALYGPQTSKAGAPRPATDTSGWADFIRRGAVGGERPVDDARDAQWW